MLVNHAGVKERRYICRKGGREELFHLFVFSSLCLFCLDDDAKHLHNYYRVARVYLTSF